MATKKTPIFSQPPLFCCCWNRDKNTRSATLTLSSVGPPYLPVGETIVGGLGGHVRKVDPLPEHVASGGRLRRSNLQTLNIDIQSSDTGHHIKQFKNSDKQFPDFNFIYFLRWFYKL